MLKNSMVNASAACCTVEQEMKEEKTLNVNIAEISAELQREKQKNAKLMERISVLESHIQGKHKDFSFSNGNACCQSLEERHFRKLKRRKVAQCNDINEDRTRKMDSEMKDHTSEIYLTKDVQTEHCLVNWMRMDDTRFLNFERSKDSDSAEKNNPDDSEDEDDQETEDSGTYTDIVDRGNVKDLQTEKGIKELKEDIDEASHLPVLGSCDHHADQAEKSSPTDMDVHKNANNEEINMLGEYKELSKASPIDHGIRRPGSASSGKKSLKMAFCPKEVKKMLGSKELSLENAQSHTMRKILVFAPLGTRHGSEDMYELDFNDFSILHKGEPYIDSKNPGEHVLYDNAGFRRKIFYPNRHNPTLCPVKILEEEKAMRLSDATCPSCLFLCIKYGGRTRNLPQNEYVRQRMGRNKLKSFGPVICRMAMLIHIRSGCFFFKALGITLLFMAGFPNDLVQRETKYKNLDLLQKYYRTDEDAEREELFLSHSETDAIHTSPNSEQGRKASTKMKSKREAISKSKTSEKATTIHSEPSYSAPPLSPFGLMGYASSPSQMTIPIPSPKAPVDSRKPITVNTTPNIHYHNQCSYPIFPMYPPNSVIPFVYRPQPNTFTSFPYPSSYGYMAPGTCISVQPYCSYYNPLMKSKREAISKSKTSEKATTIHSEPSYSAPPLSPFGLMGYASSPSQMTIPIPSPKAPVDSRKPITVNTTPNIHYHNQCSYPIFPMYPPNSVIPFVYRPQPNTFTSFPYPSSYGYMAPGTCISVQPYCSYYNPLMKSKREAISKSKTSEKATTIHSEPSYSAPPLSPFGLMGYASSPSQMTIPIPSPKAPVDSRKPITVNTTPNIHYHNQCSYPIFPMYPPNSVIPFVYRPQPNTFTSFPYPSSYGYMAPGTCISVQPYCSYYNPLMKSKREAISKSKTSEKATTIHSEPSYSAPPLSPFGLMGYASSPSQMTIPIPSPKAPVDSRKPITVNTTPNIHYHNQCSYPIFPMYPPNSVIPFVYRPQPNTFTSFPYPSSYGYMAPGTCISVQPYCSYYNPLISETLGTDEKQTGALAEAKRELNSSSSSTDSREK